MGANSPVKPGALERLSAARVWLTARIPFLGYLTIQLKARVAREADGVPTAAVSPDGALVLNERYVARLTEPQFRFLLAHEVLHPALNFWGRLGDRDLRRFNEAHDHAINLLLLAFQERVPDGEFEMPPGALCNRMYAGWSAEQIYEDLCDLCREAEAMRERQEQACEGIADPGEGAPPSRRRSRSKQAEPEPAAAAVSTPKPMSADDCRRDLGAEKGSPRESQAWRMHVATARTTHERQLGRGSLPGDLEIVIGELLEPRLDWRTALSNWVGEHAVREDHTYQRPARRSESVGELLPGVVRDGCPDVTILWDTSGSMYGVETMIFSEIGEIFRELGLTVRLIACDWGLDDVDACRPHVRGGGGSDFTPAFDRLDAERDTSVVIAFTDGYIGVPATQPESLAGVLWVVTPVGPFPGRRPVDWGEALSLTSEDLDAPLDEEDEV